MPRPQISAAAVERMIRDRAAKNRRGHILDAVVKSDARALLDDERLVCALLTLAADTIAQSRRDFRNTTRMMEAVCHAEH